MQPSSSELGTLHHRFTKASMGSFISYPNEKWSLFEKIAQADKKKVVACARGRCRSNTHGRWRARLGKLFGMLLCLATCCESHPSNLTRDAHRPQGIHHYNEPSIAWQSCWRHLHMSSMFWCNSCSQLVICVCCCVLVCLLVCLLCASRLQWKSKSIFWESDSFLHYRHKLCDT